MTALKWVSMILVVVGGINWGLVGIFKFDFVATILGDMTAIARIVYVLIGFAGVYLLTMLPKLLKE